MKLFLSLNESPLFLAIEKENIEIIKILLSNEKIDVNFGFILMKKINKIWNKLFVWHTFISYLIQFLNKLFNEIQYLII